jgi:hypothetical protein
MEIDFRDQEKANSIITYLLEVQYGLKYKDLKKLSFEKRRFSLRRRSKRKQATRIEKPLRALVKSLTVGADRP